MTTNRHTEADRERAIFPETVLAFIQETQPREWAKLEALHGDRTRDQVFGDLCKWMDANGWLATLRHGFMCYGRTDAPCRVLQGRA
jgi:type I restriction enzyme R subunit